MAYDFMWTDSPVGPLRLVARDAALVGILWQVERANRTNFEPMTENLAHPVLVETARQLAEYFAGQRRQFEIPLAFQGTPFQRQVWAALLTIPFGETRTYGQIASQIGRASAVRAVGAANGRNPIAIIAPCHRVIGATGELTGFAGGLATKETLLAVEGQGQAGGGQLLLF